MANLQTIALDTTTPQLRAPGTGDGYSFDSGATNLGSWTITGLTATTPITATSLIVTGATVPTNGFFLGAANSVSIATNSTEHWLVNASGNLNPVGTKGIGTNIAPVSEVVATTISTSPAGSGSNLTGTTFAADGTDTNIGLNITPKGTGRTTITNLTSTSPRFVTSINDTNGNEVFLITATASAVNEVNVTNGATGTGPTLAASGGDTNINLRLAPKGTGQVQELVSSTYYALASQYDVGTAPNQIPLNQYLGTMAFQDAVAVSVGQLRANGSGGIGYSTGSGGAVTQATSRTTGVTLNAVNGAITLVSAAGTATWQTFTVTNNTVAATDTINICQKSGTDLYMIHVTAVAAGSFNITFATTGGTTTEQPVFNFAVIKGVTA